MSLQPTNTLWSKVGQNETKSEYNKVYISKKKAKN